MEGMTEVLSAYFKKVDDIDFEEPTNDEMLLERDYWEFKDPKEVEAWSLKMVPHIDDMHFNIKYKKSPTFIPIMFEENVKRIVNDVYPKIKIHCVTKKNDLPPEKQYHFTLLFNSDKIYFNISLFLESLEPTPYVEELKDLERKVDAKEYNNEDGSPLTGKWLCTKLGFLMYSFLVFKDKHNMQ